MSNISFSVNLMSK